MVDNVQSEVRRVNEDGINNHRYVLILCMYTALSLR